MSSKKKWLIFQSHPIQYFSPLYKEMESKGFEMEVNYYSSHGLKGELDKEFQSKVRWDIPVLEGYGYKWLKNFSPFPSVYNFFGCINLGIVSKIISSKDNIVLVYGWKYVSDILVLLFGALSRNKVCLRMEMPWNQERLKTGLKARLKRWVLKNMIFPRIDYLLYLGVENRKFYEHLGVPKDKLLFAPYSVDNARFRSDYEKYASKKINLRSELGIPTNKFTFLFSGKLIDKKRPMDLLMAFKSMSGIDNCHLVFLGDGPLRRQMDDYINEHKLDNVLVTGFVNQSEVSKYYAIADTFVMCSGSGETWGLSTNEAMNFSLPLIVSDLTGCNEDLVHQKENGYTYAKGNIEMLSSRMDEMCALSQEKIVSYGKFSTRKIEDYSYGKLIENLALIH